MKSDTGALTLPSLGHICVVVKDLDKTTKFLSSLFGLGPWHTEEFAEKGDDLSVGDSYKVKHTWTELGPTLLELIQPIEGKTVWSEFIETKGEGLHHICFRFSNWDELVSKITEHGGRMLVGGIGGRKEGGPRGTRHFGYFDIGAGGIIIEFEEKLEGETHISVYT